MGAYAYLKDLLTRLPTHRASQVAKLPLAAVTQDPRLIVSHDRLLALDMG
ncbi:MAG: hypothetical protein MUP09_01850 [Thiovulaceae bacterium]|nr:hypothetical protein [Sulfurimonadaceae bacterium]